MLGGNNKQAIVIIIPRAKQQAYTVIDKSKLMIAWVVWHFNVNLLYCRETSKKITKQEEYQGSYATDKMFYRENVNTSWNIAGNCMTIIKGTNFIFHFSNTLKV